MGLNEKGLDAESVNASLINWDDNDDDDDDLVSF